MISGILYLISESMLKVITQSNFFIILGERILTFIEMHLLLSGTTVIYFLKQNKKEKKYSNNFY